MLVRVRACMYARPMISCPVTSGKIDAKLKIIYKDQTAGMKADRQAGGGAYLT